MSEAAKRRRRKRRARERRAERDEARASGVTVEELRRAKEAVAILEADLADEARGRPRPVGRGSTPQGLGFPPGQALLALKPGERVRLLPSAPVFPELDYRELELWIARAIGRLPGTRKP
jgi:hypothetical protein